MEYGICDISIIPVRKEPSERSEMVTQLIFGELYEVIEKYDKWIFIKLSLDGYEGWVSQNQYFPLSKSDYSKINKFPIDTTAELLSELYSKNRNEKYNIPLGSSLPNLRNNNISFDDMNFVLRGDTFNPCIRVNRKRVTNVAKLYLNAPYLWGGRTPFGIDCSGFTQIVFKINGIKLPRDASQQANLGETISFISEANPGDLAFFDNEEEEIIHVGIILSDNRIIHASGRVRTDNIDHYGIFNKESKKYTHKLRLLKTLIY
jgi:hypothetical protein